MSGVYFFKILKSNLPSVDLYCFKLWSVRGFSPYQ